MTDRQLTLVVVGVDGGGVVVGDGRLRDGRAEEAQQDELSTHGDDAVFLKRGLGDRRPVLSDQLALSDRESVGPFPPFDTEYARTLAQTRDWRLEGCFNADAEFDSNAEGERTSKRASKQAGRTDGRTDR